MTDDSLDALISTVVSAARDKGAEDFVGLRVGELVAYTDAMLICSARNDRMARAIGEEVRLRVKHEHGIVPSGSDGAAATGWQVMDYLDCVVHIFTGEARERYRLEDLWRDAPAIPLDGS